jgi:hypothetical protein
MATSNNSNEKPKKSRAAARKKGDAPADANLKSTRAARPASKQASSGARRAESPTYEQIAVRAFEIWERQGRPEGQQMENWLQAEKELRKEAGL